MDISIQQLSAFDVGKRHKEVLPMIESAIKHADGEYTVQDIIDSISAGTQGCLGVFDGLNLIGVFTVMLITYPQRRVLRLVTMGGLPMDTWESVEPFLIDYTKSVNCEALEFWCRDGAAKIAAQSFNAKRQYNVLIREI